MVLVMGGGKWVFHLEYQFLAVNELQSGIILRFLQTRTAGKLGFGLFRQRL